MNVSKDKRKKERKKSKKERKRERERERMCMCVFIAMFKTDMNFPLHRSRRNMTGTSSASQSLMSCGSVTGGEGRGGVTRSEV